MTRPTPAQIAREESARQAVVVVAGLILLAAGVAAERYAIGAADTSRGRMAAWLAAERGFARLAGWSWRRAEWARLRYEAARP